MAQKFTPFDSRSFSSGSQMESALFFAKQGVPVLPLYAPAKNGCHCNKGANCSSAGKHPMTKHGFKDATVNPVQIRSWWQTVPNANIGFVTGKESGLIVLDVDPRHGGDDSLAQLQQEFGALPKTLKVRTGGDGWHYYFLHPGTHIPNKTSMRAGLDVRGDGGYIVAPPSLHLSQKHYQWDGETVEVSPLPSWLLELIVKKEVATVAKPHTFLGEGSRNNSLQSIAGFLTSKGLQVDQLGSALQIFNETLCHPPLGVQEVAQIVSSIARYQEATWEEPQPLPEEIKAQELDASFLPKPLKAWCEDISERMQVPLEFVAGPALVMFASLIGRKMVVCPKQKDKWEVVPKLWGLLISPPGSLKSPTLNAVLKPLNELSIKARAEFIQAQQKLKEREVVAKTEIEALKDSLKKAVRDGKPDQIAQKKALLEATVHDFEEKNKLTEKRYVANDPTTEKLLTIIADNPQGILLFRDELSGWLESMQKSGREGDREFFLESWNGDTPFTMDRIGRGTVSVEGLCLSVLGGLQPSKFGSYVASVVKGGKSDDGLLQRFQILLYPERRKTWYKVDREPNEQAFKTIQKIVEVIDAIPHPKRTENGIERLKVRYDDEAQQIADEWAENLEYRLINEKMSPIFEGHLSKFRSLMPSLALIFCTLEQAGKSAGKLPESIDSRSVELAIEWCFFLETHAKRAYGEVLEPGKAAARHLLAKIHKKAVRDFDRPRDLYRKRWKGLGTAEDFEAAISTLAEYGWLRVETLSSDGRSTEVIRLHPSLRVG